MESNCGEEKNLVAYSCWLTKGTGGRLLHFWKTQQDLLKYLTMHVSCCTSLVYHRIQWIKENYNNELYTGANWISVSLKIYSMCPALHAFKDISWLKSVSFCSNETLVESTSVLNKTLVIMHRFKLAKIKNESPQFSLSFPAEIPASHLQLFYHYLPFYLLYMFDFSFFCASFFFYLVFIKDKSSLFSCLVLTL